MCLNPSEIGSTHPDKSQNRVLQWIRCFLWPSIHNVLVGGERLQRVFRSTVLSAAGVFIIFVGTYVHALPDLQREWRLPFYRHTGPLRVYYNLKEDIREMDRGVRPITEDRRICNTFLDHLDDLAYEDLPEEAPKKIEAEAARIVVTHQDDTVKAYCRGSDPQRQFMKVVSLALERECRILGMGIIWVGSLLALVGVFL
jgi:hypothetical protein